MHLSHLQIQQKTILCEYRLSMLLSWLSYSDVSVENKSVQRNGSLMWMNWSDLIPRFTSLSLFIHSHRHRLNWAGALRISAPPPHLVSTASRSWAPSASVFHCNHGCNYHYMTKIIHFDPHQYNSLFTQRCFQKAVSMFSLLPASSRIPRKCMHAHTRTHTVLLTHSRWVN